MTDTDEIRRETLAFLREQALERWMAGAPSLMRLIDERAEAARTKWLSGAPDVSMGTEIEMKGWGNAFD